MTPDQTIEFSVPYTVKPKQADRQRIIRPKHGKAFIQHYPPVEVTRNAAELRLLFSPFVPAAKLKGPVRLTVILFLPWRTAETKRNRACGRMPKDTLPDADNYCKQVCDVLQRAGFVKNDGQFSTETVRKRWGPSPMIWVRLEPDDCDSDEDLESEASDGH